jgi:hypothetical protein
MPKVECPCCGGVGIVEAGPPPELTPRQIRIYNALRKAKDGLSIQVLTDKVYAERIDGGPIGACNSVRNAICLMNKRLVTVNEKATARHCVYRLIHV